MDVNQCWSWAIRSWAQDKRWRIVAAWRLAENLNRLDKREFRKQLGIGVVNTVIREPDHTSIIPTHHQKCMVWPRDIESSHIWTALKNGIGPRQRQAGNHSLIAHNHTDFLTTTRPFWTRLPTP